MEQTARNNDMSEITVSRTGNTFSIASSEYEITFPDGHKELVWSPVWNGMTEEEEDEEACKLADKIWQCVRGGWDYPRAVDLCL